MTVFDERLFVLHAIKTSVLSYFLLPVQYMIRGSKKEQRGIKPFVFKAFEFYAFDKMLSARETIRQLNNMIVKIAKMDEI